ncbi:hypothetical protein NQ318_019830 [Aromia moschata]|uniref:RecA family profile 1 domain-containing protein n=1 Tax=Aromia moschata TaxID=1265417 RepID=A0AAV8YLW5_9CUCU|nr:hypothetical protein NQ318_019830 [Aromia moschata]
MERLRNVIGLEVYQKFLDGNIDTISSILLKPLSELQQLTGIPIQQLEEARKRASEIILESEFSTADKIPAWERLGTGCSSIDSILSGGIPINGLSEIFGCSGVGKTQLCLQLALTVQLPQTLGGKEKGAVYLCTEDVFPSKRLHQLAASFQAKYRLPQLDFESGVYLEHVADYEQLRRCLCVRLPQLLRVKNIGLLVVDSIAGVFRSENEDVLLRHQGAGHEQYSRQFARFVCVNQVTENVDLGVTEPCLGLAWGNNVTCRFGITRYDHNPLREFEVVFAPDLPNRKCSFAITEEGIVNVGD